MTWYSNGVAAFGFFEGMIYDDDCHESFDAYRSFHNSIPKETIIRHIETLPIAYSSLRTYDLFTGDELGNAGLYNDGPFTFPIDFLRYYKAYDIGIPPEYERYLTDVIGLSVTGDGSL